VKDVAWVRLDVTTLDKDWLEELDPLCGLAWIRLMSYLRSSAPSQKRPGRAPVMSPRTCERLWRVPSDLVQVMLQAAQKAGELVEEDGQWQAADTSPFVSQRTAEYRSQPSKPQADTPVKEPEVSAHSDDSSHSADFAEKRRKTRKTTKNDEERENPETLSRDKTRQDNVTVANATGDGAPSGCTELVILDGGGSSQPEPLMTPYARCERIIEAVRAQAGWSRPKPADVRRDLNAKGPTLAGLLEWLEEQPDSSPQERLASKAPPVIHALPNLAERAAAVMFLRALGSWKGEGQPAWAWVFANRDPLLSPAKFTGIGPQPSTASLADQSAALAREADRILAGGA
jgi:hypothetical protein